VAYCDRHNPPNNEAKLGFRALSCQTLFARLAEVSLDPEYLAHWQDRYG